MPGHLDYVANGLGAPSVLLMCWMGEGLVPGSLSITADTGSELDCVWSTGERTTAKVYFDRVVLPLSKELGVEAVFVRARLKDGTEMMSITEHTQMMVEAGTLNHIKQPLFGSNGGRLRQVCTDRWKIRAINQELRRRVGMTGTARSAQGIHKDEAWRRIKGQYEGDSPEGFATYRMYQVRNKVQVPVRWQTAIYPFADRGLGREQIYAEMRKRGIPYLITSECDDCPHKDRKRWLRTDPAVLVQIAKREETFGGQFFYTDRRRPLLGVIEEMRREESQGNLFEPDPDFGCNGALCGV